MPELGSAAARVRAVFRPGLLVLPLASLSVAVHLWMASSVLVPIQRDDAVETLFVSATFGTFVFLWGCAFAGVVALHAVVRQLARRDTPEPPLLSRADVEYLRPLFVFAVSVLPLLSLAPGLPHVLSVWWYLLADLRWWWSALVLVWVLAGGARRAAPALARWRDWSGRLQAARPRMFEIALLAIALTWATAGTRHLRFDASAVGDEPKYVRYCEAFYQGLGFELSGLRPLSELPPDFQPRVWNNVVLLATTVPAELGSLASDAVAFVRDPTRRFNRARRLDGFLEGKSGGLYQVYNPGISMLMFPAYYVDRRLGDGEPGSGPEWPAKLDAVNAFFLGVYGLWCVVIFRFLRRCVGVDSVAWIATLALTLTLPVAAFPFQFYPETAAGLMLSAVAAFILFPQGRGRFSTLLHGLLAGYLPWFHVRFSLVAAVLALWAVWALRRDLQTRLVFIGGFSLTLGGYLLYSYHLTGSILPTAIWLAEGSEPAFSLPGALRTSAAYLVDQNWGLFAHVPVYLAALPGYWWLARRRRDMAWLAATTFAALLVPAAGHTLSAAGSSPMRLIVAALPLAATPIVEVLARKGSVRAFQVLFGLLLIVSLDNALAYNLHHVKSVGPLVDWSFSGWKVNLLFPMESREPWQISIANGVVLVAWLTLALALLVAPALLGKARSARLHRWRPPTVASLASLSITAAIALGLAGTAVASFTGVSAKSRYWIPTEEAALEASSLLDDIGHCAICATSTRGRISTEGVRRQLKAASPQAALLGVARACPTPPAVEPM